MFTLKSLVVNSNNPILKHIVKSDINFACNIIRWCLDEIPTTPSQLVESHINDIGKGGPSGSNM